MNLQVKKPICEYTSSGKVHDCMFQKAEHFRGGPCMKLCVNSSLCCVNVIIMFVGFCTTPIQQDVLKLQGEQHGYNTSIRSRYVIYTHTCLVMYICHAICDKDYITLKCVN